MHKNCAKCAHFGGVVFEGRGGQGREDFNTEVTESTEMGRSGRRRIETQGERGRKEVASHRTPYTGMGSNYQRRW
jgi:hypothetical protein